MVLKNRENDYSGMISEFIFLNGAKTIVEIGVNKGETTVALCEAASKTGGKVHGFDLWDTHGLFDQFGQSGSKKLVETKLKKYGLNNYTLTTINTFDKKFPSVVKDTVEGKIDIAFIDGCHSYKGCLNDLQAVWPLVSDIGVIVFHDTQRIDGCREIVYDLRTKFYDGTYDVFDMHGGYGNRNMGISFLVKRQFPKLKVPINQLCGSPNTAQKIETLEKEWYENEIKTSTSRPNFINLMDVNVEELKTAKIDNFRPKRKYLS